MKPRIFRAFGWMGLFGLCYLAGATAAEMKEMKADQSVLSEQVVLETKDWGLGFSKE